MHATADMSKEDYYEKVKEFFKIKGLKYDDDFSDDEKKAIIDDNCVNQIGPTILSKKYNTLVFVITRIVQKEGWSVTPDDLSVYPDFPKKSDDISNDEYQEIIKKYWKTKKNRKDLERKREKAKLAKIAKNEAAIQEELGIDC